MTGVGNWTDVSSLSGYFAFYLINCCDGSVKVGYDNHPFIALTFSWKMNLIVSHCVTNLTFQDIALCCTTNVTPCYTVSLPPMSHHVTLYHYHQCHTVFTVSLPPMSHRVTPCYTVSLPPMSHCVTPCYTITTTNVTPCYTVSLPPMSHRVTPCYTVSLTDDFRRLRRSSCAWWLASLRCSTSLPVVDRMLSSRVQRSRSSSSSCSSLAMLWECGGVRVWGCECVCEGVGVCVRGVRGVWGYNK